MDQQYVIRHDKFRRLPRHDILRPHIPQELQTSKIPTQKWPILKTQTTQIQHRLLRIKLAFPYLDIGLRPFHLETSGGESLDRKSGDFRHSSYILYISTHFIFSYYTHQKAWQRDDEFESFANDRISSSYRTERETSVHFFLFLSLVLFLIKGINHSSLCMFFHPALCVFHDQIKLQWIKK